MGPVQTASVLLAILLAITSCGSGGPKFEPGPAPSEPAWSMAGGNPQRNGQSTLPGPELGSAFTLLEDYWVFDDIEADVFSGITRHVVDDDGNIYFASLDTIYALGSDGSARWTRNVLDDEFDAGYYMDTNCAPVIYDEKFLVFASGAEDILCMDFDGNLKWKTSLEGDGTQLIAAEGRIYATAGFSIHSLDNAGNQLWETDLGNWISWDILPAISPDGNLLLSMDENGFVALDTSGNELWRYLPASPAAELASNIMYAGEMWIIPDANGWTALSEAGELLWQLGDETAAAGVRSAPVVDPAGQLYFLMSAEIGEHRNLVACNRDGQIQWSKDNLQGSNSKGQDLMVDARGRIYAMYLRGVTVYSSSGDKLGAFQYLDLDWPQQFWTLSITPQNKLIVGARSAGIVGMR